MALQMNWKHTRNDGTEVILPNVYVKIIGVGWNLVPPSSAQPIPDRVSIRYAIYLNQEMRELLPLNRILSYTHVMGEGETLFVPEGSNLVKAAYEHSKTLPLFSEAVDV